MEVEALKGEGIFRWLAHAQGRAAYEEFVREAPDGAVVDWIRPLENQYLLQRRRRMFGELDLPAAPALPARHRNRAGHRGWLQRRAERRATASWRSGCSSARASACSCSRTMSDAAEKRLLIDFIDAIEAEDPDVIEGHNIFKFDLDYLRLRCRRHRVPCAWGRFGQRATFRNAPAQGGGALDRLPALRPAGPRRGGHLPARAALRHHQPRDALLRAEGCRRSISASPTKPAASARTSRAAGSRGIPRRPREISGLS